MRSYTKRQTRRHRHRENKTAVKTLATFFCLDAHTAQAAIHQLRQRLGDPYRNWDAAHLAKSLFNGLDGDIRVIDDTIFVTFYNAPNTEQLRHHYEHLPEKLAEQGVDPHIPWLYDFKLDFRFK